jgi:hypothetical protein
MLGLLLAGNSDLGSRFKMNRPQFRAVLKSPLPIPSMDTLRGSVEDTEDETVGLRRSKAIPPVRYVTHSKYSVGDA